MLDALIPAVKAMKEYIVQAKANVLGASNEQEGPEEMGMSHTMNNAVSNTSTSIDDGAYEIMEIELDSVEMLKLACDAADEGAIRTKSMEALAGRSNYINSSMYLDKAEDPGARAIAYIFKALYEAVRNL